VIAFLLSKGFATVPVSPDYYLDYPGTLEGTNKAGSPHMVPIGEPLAIVEQKWYFIPVEVNEKYAKRFNETVRLAGGSGGVPIRASRGDGERP